MSNIKQVIVVRNDLNMRRGKFASQVAHASMKVFFDRITWNGRELDNNNKEVIISVNSDMFTWINGEFTKIVLQANSEEELMTIYDTANFAGLPVALIEDNGHTEFHGVKTKTCIAIGPAKSEDIDKITGHLKLF